MVRVRHPHIDLIYRRRGLGHKHAVIFAEDLEVAELATTGDMARCRAVLAKLEAGRIVPIRSLQGSET